MHKASPRAPGSMRTRHTEVSGPSPSVYQANGARTPKARRRLKVKFVTIGWPEAESTWEQLLDN